jgi:hypothetical protein
MFTQNPATDPEELLKAADSAMYENKRRRRVTRPAPRSDQPDQPGEADSKGGGTAASGLYAVPSPRDSEPAPYPAPTPAPRHAPSRPGDTEHPAHSRKAP